MSSLVPHGERTAKAYYNAEGWIAHVITNPLDVYRARRKRLLGRIQIRFRMAVQQPVGALPVFSDKNYLQKIYPVLKGSAQFYAAILVKEPKTGWLVTSPSPSPENHFYMPDGSGKHTAICMGPPSITRSSANYLPT